MNVLWFFPTPGDERYSGGQEAGVVLAPFLTQRSAGCNKSGDSSTVDTRESESGVAGQKSTSAAATALSVFRIGHQKVDTLDKQGGMPKPVVIKDATLSPSEYAAINPSPVVALSGDATKGETAQ